MTFNNETVARLLSEAPADPAKYAEVVDYLAGQVAAARNAILYPEQPAPQPHLLAEVYAPPGSPLFGDTGDSSDPNLSRTVVDGWKRLIHDLSEAAGDLESSFATLAGDHSATKASIRALRAAQAVTMLRLWLLARFCEVRAQVNMDAVKIEVFEDRPREKKLRPRDAVDAFEKARRSYETRVRRARVTRALGRGNWQAGDARAFESWRGEFGRPRDSELGWGGVARAARIILRYHQYRKRFVSWWLTLWTLTSSKAGVQGFLRSVIRVPVRLVWLLICLPVVAVRAISILLLKFMTHLSLQPERFALVTMMTVPAFTLLYIIDDLLSRHVNHTLCHDLQWSLYYAIVNLTSLGSNDTACGPLTHYIVSAESLTGYFLLSVLAAMFFSWLTDR